MPRTRAISTRSQINPAPRIIEPPYIPSQPITRPTHHAMSSLFVQRSRTVRSLSALPMTLTDDSAMAAAAMIGDSSRPKNG